MGVLYASDPLDACSPLLNMSNPGQSFAPRFLLVERGGCNFEVKVRYAQDGGFAAVIVYNNQDDHELVTSTSPLHSLLANSDHLGSAICT